MGKLDYEERKRNRINRLHTAADKAKARSEERFDTAHRLGKMVPMGQPILVGHHSEGMARAHQRKIHNNMDKGLEESRKADDLRAKAIAAENNTAISSDDPEAIPKLKAKLAGLERLHETDKAINRAVRLKNTEKGDAKLKELGLKESSIQLLRNPEYGRPGIPGYVLSNRNANMKRIRNRIARLEAIENMETEEITIGEVRIVQDVEDNRTKIFFPGIPEAEVRTALKRRGFRWSRYNGCWQRHLSDGAKWTAEQIIKEHYEE